MSRLLQLIDEPEFRSLMKYWLERNELGDAELFFKLFENHFVFDHAGKSWYFFDKHFWGEDKTGRVNIAVGRIVAAEYQEMAKILLSEAKSASEVRAAYLEAIAKAFSSRAYRLRSKTRTNNILKLASNLPSIRLTGEEWSIDPLELPVANGIIDLTTGTLRQGKPEDYIRSFAPTGWRGLDHPAPKFERFISDIFGGNDELTNYIQRLLGYAISGDTREQILPILWGEGSNGKSTLLDILSDVLGRDFSFTTQADSLMDIRKPDGDAPRPFVCSLQDKRLVWASESQDGQWLNAGLVKQLTGDGNITARNLYSKPITFKPSHTIFLVTNHYPHLPDAGDYAMIRRLILIPFGVRFVEKPDQPNERKLIKNIQSELENEGSGILAWLVRGCIAWQENGLNPPDIVKLATTEYRESEDLVGQYIGERLVKGDKYKITAGELYKDYVQWCVDNGFHQSSIKSFGARITQGFGKSKSEWINGRTRKVYYGIGLLENDAPLPITDITDF